jgi:hypothetical protein
MSKIIPFVPTTIFPIFGREWFSGIKADMATHSAIRTKFDTFRRSKRFKSLTCGLRHRRVLRDETAIELARCRQDLRILRFLREMLEEAERLSVPPSAAVEALALTVIHTGEALIRRGRVCPWITSDEPSSERLAATRTDTRKLVVAMGNSGPHIVDAIGLHRWMAEWCATAADEDLDLLFIAISERELLTSLQANGLSAPGISVEYLEEVQRRIGTLETEAAANARAYDDVRGRIDRVAKHVFAPMAGSEGIEREWGIAASLSLYDAIKCAASIEYSNRATRLAHDPTEAVEELFLATAARDPLFWYVGASSLLRQSNAVLGAGLKPWAIALLATTIKHPANIRRANVPPEALATRSVLAKWIAPMLVGHHPDDRIADDILNRGMGRSDEGMAIFAAYLAGLGVAPDGEPHFRNRHHRQTVEQLWLRLFAPSAEPMLAWLASGVEAAASVHGMEDSEQLALEQPPDLEAGVLLPAAEEGLTVEDDAPRTWYYVPNPAAANACLVPIEIPADDGEDVFDAFLRAQVAEMQIKPASIMNALEYFLSMSPTQRAMTPYEDLLGGQRWHKLKRGSMRIYVRVEPDGRLLFHPYARKDWRQDLVAFTRRAA